MKERIQNMFDLSGKTAAITGGTGVLGAQMARTLAEAGAEILVLGRNEDKGSKISKEIRTKGGSASFIFCDVVDEDSVRTACSQIRDRYGKLDILINAAGGNLPGAVIQPEQTLEDLDLEEFRKVYDLNLLGTVLPVKIFAELLLAAERASVINISSITAQRPLTRVAGYGTAKAGIDNITRWLAVEFASKYGEKIRVNAIAPGFFLTEQNSTLLMREDGTLTERGNAIVQHTPCRRFGEPGELDGAVLWLSGNGSLFVNGTVVLVDGGFSAYSGV